MQAYALKTGGHLDIFTDNHGELPKGFQLTVTCNTSTETAKGTSFDVQPNMLVGDLVGTFNIKRLEFSCTKEQQKHWMKLWTMQL